MSPNPAEFLTLIGSWQASHKLTILAATGLVAGTIYSLRIVQKVFLGSAQNERELQDLSIREKLILVPLTVIIIWLGVFPQPVLDTVNNSLLPKKKTEITSSKSQEHLSTTTKEGGRDD